MKILTSMDTLDFLSAVGRHDGTFPDPLRAASWAYVSNSSWPLAD